MVKFIHEGQGGATPTKSPKEGFPRERNRGNVLGAGKTLALYQKPKFIPNMLGFRKDPRDPAYIDTHSDCVRGDMGWGEWNREDHQTPTLFHPETCSGTH